MYICARYMCTEVIDRSRVGEIIIFRMRPRSGYNKLYKYKKKKRNKINNRRLSITGRSRIGDFFEFDGGWSINPPKELNRNGHWMSAAGMEAWDYGVGGSFN